MAQLYPPNLAPSTQPSETRVWMALQKLNDQWRVYHSLNWKAERDGEADFVLLHPDYGLIVLEVKGGDVGVADGQWFSIDRNSVQHWIKDPFEQAMVSKKTLIAYLGDNLNSHIPAVHGVVFPDADAAVSMGLNAPASLIMAKPDLVNPEPFLIRLARQDGNPTSLGDEQATSISQLLAPTVTVRRRVSDDVRQAIARITTWTEEQKGYLDDLADNPRQLILGGAGTGKTVLAKEKARRLAAEGKHVLLTCFNKPLAQAMAAELDEEPLITVAHFHQLVEEQARSARDEAYPGTGAAMEFPPVRDKAFWDEGSADLLVAAAGLLGTRFDAVIVDEGQDFLPGWFAALEFMLPETDGVFYVFADPKQTLYRDEWDPPFEGHTFRLRKNCRNTNPIAEKVAAAVGQKVEAMGAHGPAPEFEAASNEEEMVDGVRQALHRLINEEGLEPSQVVVLCQRKADAVLLRQQSLAGQKLVRLEARSDGVVTETIHLFKGLESDACVIVLHDASHARGIAVAYVGMSRARVRLIVVGPKATPHNLNW